MLEAAIVLTVFLTLVFGGIDLALGVFRYNAISEAARRGAREAIVHGKGAPPQRTAWGPATWTGTADSPGDIPAEVRPVLVGMEPAAVNLRIEWPDGSNAAQKQVRVSVSTVYRPVLPGLVGWSEIPLTATSTMRIAH